MSATQTPGFTSTFFSRAKQDTRCDFCEGRNGHFAGCDYLADQDAISAAEAAEYDADAEEEAFYAAAARVDAYNKGAGPSALFSN